MNENRNAQIAAGKQVSRPETIQILKAAMNVKAYRFARNLASHWLTEYPGDLMIELLHAQAMLQEGREDLAIPILKRVTNTDPEFLPAQRLLALASQETPYSTAKTAFANAATLGGKVAKQEELPEWSVALLRAKLALKGGDEDKAANFIHKALTLEPDSPLVAVMHLQLGMRQYDWLMLKNLADQYNQRWPDCLVAMLVLADTLMQGGQEERAVNLLHQAQTMDIAAQVPSRLWGKDFPYKAMWPQEFHLTLPFPIPAEVSGALGWNQLPQGEPVPVAPQQKKTKVSTSERKRSKKTLFNVEKEFEKIAKRVKQLEAAKGDARFPLYVILSTRDGLEAQYGAENLVQLDLAMKEVVKACRKLRRWDSCLIYADDPECADNYGIPPAKANDPWSIKNFLKDLDQSLAQRGEMIGALLIVGGPKVVPFHRLPNPLDDNDPEVPSDNPYATPDENYFIPSWAVGRLPGGSSSDPMPLMHQLSTIVKHRNEETERESFLKRLLAKLFRWDKKNPSFGYTAEVWRRASNSVFRPIGKPHTMVISPPIEATQINKYQRKTARLAYYNLHGLEDAAEWFGQRDPIETPDGEDYPVALRPNDIVNSGRAPQVVFSEACYGAHILDKSTEEAIALKFLASGTQALVGSTVTSYGSITTPLIAADLLGKIFWNYLQEGYPAGFALQRAKIELAREMHKRQGYLDGEDQKTLISFVLYGDPLAVPHSHSPSAKNTVRPVQDASEVKIICDRINTEDEVSREIPAGVVKQVKGIVKEYLPGMNDARIIFSHEHTECTGHNCPTHQIGAKGVHRHPSRSVVTLSKHIEQGSAKHPHYARITLNQEGKMVKLAVSR